MNLAGYGIISSSLQGIRPEYLAVLTRAVSLGYALPSDAQIIKQNNEMRKLVDLGLLANFGFYLNLEGPNEGFCSINWYNPSGALSTYNGGYTFTAYQDIKFNGTTGYISTGYNPTTIGDGTYSLNDASRLAYITQSGTNTLIDGVSATVDNRMFNAASTTQRINYGTGTAGSLDLSGLGLVGLSRTSASLIYGIKAGVLSASVTKTSTSIPNDTMLIGKSSTTFGDIALKRYMVGKNINSKLTALNSVYA